MFKRILLIVLDSVGIGEADDAVKFDDVGTNTFGHTVDGNEKLNNFEKMGFYNLLGEDNETDFIYTKAKEQSNGKDTLTGHLEMMGIVTTEPFNTFPDGFPKELIDQIEKISNRKVIGNCVASGTEIIKELGEQQLKTGELIVYTSADSVLQIAAHEDIIPIDELYNICMEIRKITQKDEWKIGRIIARPFKGENSSNFVRTYNRRDYALDPVSDTVLDNLKDNKYDVISIGKISDIFNYNGITQCIKTKDNFDGIQKIIETMKTDYNGLCFANLNDFDSKYGHRRDKNGYFNALKEFNDNLPEIINCLKFDDLLIITADHGNDPTYKGTDHTRENIPVAIFSKKLTKTGKIADLDSFSDIGATILDNFNIKIISGESILKDI